MIPRKSTSEGSVAKANWRVTQRSTGTLYYGVQNSSHSCRPDNTATLESSLSCTRRRFCGSQQANHLGPKISLEGL